MELTLPFPRINGVTYDYSSIELYIDGVHVIGAKEINYNQSVKGTKIYGTKARPIGRTRGKIEAEGGMTLYRADWEELLARLGPGYHEKEIGIGVTYEENGQLHLDVLKGCRISKVDNSHSEGEDPLEVKLDLDPMWIEFDGVAPLKDMS